jgi:hypothetical protein
MQMIKDLLAWLPLFNKFFNAGKKISQNFPSSGPSKSSGSRTGLIQEKVLKKETLGWILGLKGVHQGEDFRLVRGDNTVGTALNLDVTLIEQGVNAKHCVITCLDDQFMLRDLGSTQGTFVNGKKVSLHQLIDNDEIRIGNGEFRFKCL